MTTRSNVLDRFHADKRAAVDELAGRIAVATRDGTFLALANDKAFDTLLEIGKRLPADAVRFLAGVAEANYQVGRRSELEHQAATGRDPADLVQALAAEREAHGATARAYGAIVTIAKEVAQALRRREELNEPAAPGSSAWSVLELARRLEAQVARSAEGILDQAGGSVLEAIGAPPADPHYHPDGTERDRGPGPAGAPPASPS